MTDFPANSPIQKPAMIPPSRLAFGLSILLLQQFLINPQYIP